MASAADLMLEYRRAYKSAHGSEASIELNGSLFRIATGTGSFDCYSRRDVANLTRALRMMASA